MLSVLISACVTLRAPAPLSSIPVPYVKCVRVLAAVVKRFVEPSVTLSVSMSCLRYSKRIGACCVIVCLSDTCACNDESIDSIIDTLICVIQISSLCQITCIMIANIRYLTSYITNNTTSCCDCTSECRCSSYCKSAAKSCSTSDTQSTADSCVGGYTQSRT